VLNAVYRKEKIRPLCPYHLLIGDPFMHASERIDPSALKLMIAALRQLNSTKQNNYNATK